VEVVDVLPPTKIAVDDTLVKASFAIIEAHALNATDAILLRSALDLAAPLKAAGHDLAVVSSDQRLLRAARAEGLLTFNPETQSATDLDALIGP
jgi:predicted nucleic acid-binding protein